MRVLNLEQNSPDWLEWRNAGIGSSDAPIIMNASPWKTREQLWLLKRGVVGESSRSNSAQARGHRLEPLARELYEKMMGWTALPVCGVHDEYDWLKVSLDGWNPERGICVEIKAPNRDDHQEALDGLIPEKYKWQVLHQAMVSGAKTIHYVSYSDYFSGPTSWTVVQAKPNPKDVQQLFEEEKSFWEAVVEGRPVR